MTEQVPSEQFAISEVAIWIRPGLNYGKEVTVISSLQFVRVVDGRTGEMIEGWHYQIDAPGFVQGPHVTNCKRLWGPPEHLRKKRPPAHDRTIVQWMDCPWQPEVLRV